MTDAPVLFRTVVFPADPDEPVRVEARDASYDGIRSFVGGEVEVVTMDGAALAVDAYGRAAGLPPNPRATRFADGQRPGFARGNGLILGPVLLAGFDEEGEPADVPADLERAALAQD